jgi:hypothetical protein
MGRVEKMVHSSRGLRSVGIPRKNWRHMGLCSTVEDGPANVIGRELELRLNENDINWIIAVLAADVHFSQNMKTVLAARDSLLTEAVRSTTSPMRRVSIMNNLRDHLRKVLAT